MKNLGLCDSAVYYGLNASNKPIPTAVARFRERIGPASMGMRMAVLALASIMDSGSPLDSGPKTSPQLLGKL